MDRKLYAVLIGNSEFPDDPKLPPLRCPPKDLEAMARVLGSERHGPYEITLLADKTHAEIKQSVYKVLKGARQEDRVLIYYSGHGKLNDDDGNLFLATRDTDSTALPISSLAAGEIRKFMDWSASREVILILDCCFSGAIGKGFRGSTAEQAEQSLRDLARAEGRYILTASTASQIAEERPEDANGLLTKHIVAGIEDGEADRDDDGQVSMAELLRYVSEEVRKEGKQKPKGYFVDAEGELIIATTGRPARDKKRNAIIDRMFELRAKHYIRPTVISSILNVIDLDLPKALQPVAYDFIDKLHRACEDTAKFEELIHRIPAALEQSTQQTSAETDELRRERDLVKGENKSLKDTLAELNRKLEAAASDVERLQSEMAGSQDRANRLDQQLSAAAADKQAAERKLAKVLRAGETASASAKAAEEQASELAKQVTKLTAELSAAQKAKKTEQDTLAALRIELAAAASAKQAAEAESGERAARIRTLESDLTAARKELKAAKTPTPPAVPPATTAKPTRSATAAKAPQQGAAAAHRANEAELQRVIGYAESRWRARSQGGVSAAPGPGSAADARAANQAQLERLRKPAAGAPENEKDWVLSILKRHSKESESFYVSPKIPEKKEASARETMQIPAAESVVGLIDVTVFGSGKDGIAFTEKGLYFRNYMDSSDHIPYRDMGNCTIAGTIGGALIVDHKGKKKKLELAGSGVKQNVLDEILKALKNISL